jgi:hypothetical protein
MIRPILALIFLTAAACAPKGAAFARLLGPADHMEIPIYRGTPPVIYTHVRLGTVSGKGGAWSSLAEQKYRALYNLSKVAQEKGGNAVIEVVGRSTSEGWVYSGEAARFDILPPDPECAPAEGLPRDPRRGD